MGSWIEIQKHNNECVLVYDEYFCTHKHKNNLTAIVKKYTPSDITIKTTLIQILFYNLFSYHSFFIDII